MNPNDQSNRPHTLRPIDFNDLFLRACRREPVQRTPVWYMRQAGRYQPEYREIRKKYTLMEICEHPELCARVTNLPVEQLEVDAAILFSDIMVPVSKMGVQLSLQKDVGPIIESPIRTQMDVDRLRALEPEEDLPYVFETIRQLKRDLRVPLIGFAGGPFTLASYLIEGGPSKQYLKTKAFMYTEPDAWRALMDKLGDMVVCYLRAQVLAGADAVQVFDSWVGSLSPADFTQYVLPTMKRLFSALSDLNVATIYFGVGTGELLPTWNTLDVGVIGVDWRVSLTAANARLKGSFAFQGNLDPAVLYAPWSEIERRARNIIDEGVTLPGHIFNLGHGVSPGVSVEVLQRLTQFVHDYSTEVRGRNE